jgi:ABC-type antimicrobial peptide transport system permease subunit
MTRLVERRLEPQRNRALTVVTVSALALVMIQLGLYGLVGRTIVSQARRIAVELALGASDLQAVRNSLGFILAVVAAGIAAGDGLALLLLNRWQDTLTKSSGVEPVLVGAISCLIACFALIAFYVACRRVLRLEPAEAFRWEAMTGQ